LRAEVSGGFSPRESTKRNGRCSNPFRNSNRFCTLQFLHPLFLSYKYPGWDRSSSNIFFLKRLHTQPPFLTTASTPQPLPTHSKKIMLSQQSQGASLAVTAHHANDLQNVEVKNATKIMTRVVSHVFLASLLWLPSAPTFHPSDTPPSLLCTIQP